MEKLTKEQKLEMVSKAIDMGFKVELKLHRISSEEQLDEALSVFDKDIPRALWGSSDEVMQFAGIRINETRAYEDNFTAGLFIDNLRGESS